MHLIDPRVIPAFALRQSDGTQLVPGELKGHWTLVFLGFTHCPDVCPTTLADLASVVQQLGSDADGVQVLFVTLDPERDRALLGQYLPAFHPKFVGLYGDAAATARTAQEFKVYYDKRPAQAGGYSVDHTAGIYVFDREGRLRVFAPYGAQQAALVHDIRLLLKGA